MPKVAAAPAETLALSRGTKYPTKKGNMSEQKKNKVNVRDLKPNKDAKGGGGAGRNAGTIQRN